MRIPFQVLLVALVLAAERAGAGHVNKDWCKTLPSLGSSVCDGIFSNYSSADQFCTANSWPRLSLSTCAQQLLVADSYQRACRT